LLLAWARRAALAAAGPLCGGLLFAAHPVHTDAVNQLVGLAESLACACACGSVLAYANAMDDSRAPQQQGRRLNHIRMMAQW